jgi:hypothetical protein
MKKKADRKLFTVLAIRKATTMMHCMEAMLVSLTGVHITLSLELSLIQLYFEAKPAFVGPVVSSKNEIVWHPQKEARKMQTRTKNESPSVS